MIWRYLSLALLLLSPGSRIFTFASFSEEKEEVSHAREVRETEDELIDRIVNELLGEDSLTDGAFTGEGTSKRDEVDASSAGVESVPLDKDANVQLSADPPKPSDNEESKEEVVVYHQPGQTAALQQGAANKESKVISSDDRDFMITMFVISCVGFVGLMMAGVCYYKFRRSAKAASDVEYPAYGVTGPMKERVPSPGDRKLAQSAQMYHYQHQKQQMIAMEKANGDMKHDASDDDSEEDNVEGDYTVYECPGLAPTGEMEVKNPLFRGSDTPQAPGPPDSGSNQQTPSAPGE